MSCIQKKRVFLPGYRRSVTRIGGLPMNMNRPDMTETVKSENYTNKFLQKDSNPVTMKASKSPAIGSSDQTKATSCLPGGGNRPAFGDFSSRCVQPLQHHEGFPGAAHRHQHPGEQAEFRQLVCGGLREVKIGRASCRERV